MLNKIRQFFKFLKKFHFLYIFKGFFKLHGVFYFYYKKWYAAPSLRQSQILKSYVTSNNLYHQREGAPNYFLNKIRRNGSVILDIGGNLGYSALHYSRILEGIDSTVCFSFEPVSSNFSKMIFNFGHLKNIFFLNFGISEDAKILKFGLPDFFDNSDEHNSGLYTSKNVNSNFLTEECRVFSLDSFINFLNLENETIQYIKIDIEGSELEAICGASNVLENHNPVIQIEYNPNANSHDEFAKIINNLSSLKYYPYKTKSSFDESNGFEVFFIKNESLDSFRKEEDFNRLFEPALFKFN